MDIGNFIILICNGPEASSGTLLVGLYKLIMNPSANFLNWHIKIIVDVTLVGFGINAGADLYQK